MFNDVWPSLVLGSPVSQGLALLRCIHDVPRNELLKDKAFAGREKFFTHEVRGWVAGWLGGWVAGWLGG